jgi:hypothetical protein
MVKPTNPMKSIRSYLSSFGFDAKQSSVTRYLLLCIIITLAIMATILYLQLNPSDNVTGIVIVNDTADYYESIHFYNP